MCSQPRPFPSQLLYVRVGTLGAGDRRTLSVDGAVLDSPPRAPLHLCTHQNLESIGNRLGKVDTIDAAKGKINVEMESSKPLKFSRKLQTINKEDITIKLHYEKVFKHCTTCGLMSHEAQDCLTK